jgi:hypothetical protein
MNNLDSGNSLDEHRSAPDSFVDYYKPDRTWPEGAEVIEQRGNAVIVKHGDIVSAIYMENGVGPNADFREGSMQERAILARRHIDNYLQEYKPVFAQGDRIIKKHEGYFIVDRGGRVTVVDPGSGMSYPVKFCGCLKESDPGGGDRSYQEKLEVAEAYASCMAARHGNKMD